MKVLRMIKERYKNLMCIALSFALFISTFSLINQDVQAVTYIDGNGATVTEYQNGDVASVLVVDDTKFTAFYSKDKDEYSLYVNYEVYRLSSEVQDDMIIFGLADTDDLVLDNKVIGQAAIALPLIYWTPTFIAAAKAVMASIVVAISGYSVWYIVDDIARVIDTTYVQTGTPSQVTGAVYAAELINGNVVISSEITPQQATDRLISGRDIFATTSEAAYSVATLAGVNWALPTHHPAHGGDGYYPHWHPKGRTWYKNSSHSPHAWYGLVI